MMMDHQRKDAHEIQRFRTRELIEGRSPIVGKKKKQRMAG